MEDKDKLAKQRIAELLEMHQRIAELEESETGRKRVEKELSGRVKELQCLYSIARIIERPGITLDELYQEVVNLLPASWRYPEIACARITFADKEFKTPSFKITEWQQAADINVKGQKKGTVEIYYLEARPEADEGPFSKEGRLLIDTVAKQLGRITERVQAEERLLHLNETLRLIRRINQLIVETENETELLQKACARLTDSRQYKLVWIGFIQEGSYDVLPVAQAGFEEGYLSSVKITWDDSECGQGPTGTAIRTGKPSIMRDILNDPEYRPWWEQALKRGCRSAVALPLMFENRVIGALNVYSERPDAFDSVEVDLLVELAGDISLGIEKIRQREQRRQAEEEQARLQRRLTALWKIARMVDADYQTLCDHVLGEILAMTESRYAFFGFLNEDESVMTLYSWSREALEDCQTRDRPIEYPIAKAGLWGDAMRRRGTLIINDYQADHPSKKGLPEGHVPITRLLVVPVFSHSRIVSLGAVANKENEYTGADAEQVRAFMTNAHAILEKRQAEEMLQKSKGSLAEAQRLAHIGSWDLDLVSNILTWSDEACRIFGLTPQEFGATYEAFLENIHPDDREMANKAYAESVRSKTPYNIVHRLLLKDGTVKYVNERCETLYGDDGKPIRSIGTVQDITERKRAEEELRQSFEKLQRTLEETVHALASTADKRDPYTAGHQRRVTQLACAIAREMNLPEEQVTGIHVGGTLHDIGKIYVPAEILSKPTSLTETEFAMIKTHPQVTYDILRTIEFPWPVAQIVLQHHERLDGSGYPQGLSGEDILLGARILGVADVVEAMSSHRPYRPALGIDKALFEILQNKGVLYDSEVVDACLGLFNQKGFKFEQEGA